MKTSHMLLALAVAVAAMLPNADATLGTGPMAATSPSRLDSSAGSVMGPSEPANVDPNAPTKPGSLPSTAEPADGGVAGGFASETANSSETGSGAKGDSTVTQPSSTTTAPTPAPTTSSAASSFGAATVVTIVSVAALAW